jgi:hypothetical protein
MTTYQNLWDIGKAVLRGKFIAMIAFIKKSERSQINNRMMHKFLERQEQAKPKSSRWEEINELEMKRAIQTSNERKS